MIGWAGTKMLVLVVLPVLAGIAVAAQSALNGRVGAVTGSPWVATLISFVVAALALLRSLGERACAQLKTWDILRELRCCPWRAGRLAQAIHVLRTREIKGMKTFTAGSASPGVHGRAATHPGRWRS